MGVDADPEVLRLKKLEEHYLRGSQDKPRPYAQLLDHFKLLGPSIGSVYSLYGQLQQALRPETILRASKQLLEGVEFVHQAGLVHGEISAGNVAFTYKKLLSDEDDDLLDLLSEVYVANPWPDKPLPSPHLPTQLVQTAKWGTWEDETVEDIRLVDWGSAFPVGETVSVETMAQPIDFRSAESFFIGKFDHRHDIWRAGCVMYVLFYQKPPFFIFVPDSHFYLRRMIRKLGPLPDKWLPKFAELGKETIYTQEDDGQGGPAEGEWELIGDCFDSRRQTITSEFTSGDEKYDGPGEYTDYDFEALKSLQRPLQALLQYEPEKRDTLKDAMGMIEWIDHCREEGGRNDGKEEENN